MYRLFMIAKNNMKKQKGDMFTFFILTFLTAFLIFDSASAMLGLGRILDDRFQEINGAHVMIINLDTEAEQECAEKAIEKNPHIIDYEKTPMLQFGAEYRKKGEQDYSSYTFFAESFTQEKRIMKVADEKREYQKNDILLPYHLKSSYQVDDVMQVKIGEEVYDFNIAGFLEDPYFCSTMNITIFSVCLSPEMMDQMVQDHPGNVLKGYVHKGIADVQGFADAYTTNDLEKEITESYKNYLKEYAEKNPGNDYTNYMAINWEMMKGGSQFLPIIVMAILLLFAGMILVISMVIISFSIKNFIQRNMKNTGILEASGYTVRELRISLILQILLVAMAGVVAGIGVAIATFRSFGDVVGSVLGLRWNQPVNWGAAAGTLLGILVVIWLVGIKISSTYKKITVLDALRGGINTHNYKKNYFPLDKTPLPVPLALSLKETFGGLGRNCLMVIISSLLVISTLIGFGLVENFAKNTDNLVNMLAFETCTDVVTAVGCDKDLSEDLRKLSGVDGVLVNMGFEPVVYYGDQKSSYYCYAVDDLNNTRCTNLLEGRYPERDNEIMVTPGIADDFGVKIGDILEIEYAGKKEEYLITGINQRLERMGRTIYMRIDGAKRILSGEVVSAYRYYVYAKEGVSYEEVKGAIEKYAGEKELELQHEDNYKEMRSTIAMVTLALNAICIAIIVITMIIVIFVEALVIRAKIAREWRSMGISKALGQTSGGLIMQIMLSNLPAIFAGAILGGLVAPFVGRTLVKTMFSLFAVQRVCFGIPFYYVLVTVAGIIIVAILTSGAVGLKVRKLKAVAMITEE
ncbi:MAG: ABC transporter permease [Lachnospiraceae bacterium]|nr:ABC transporter permease [Lachnospiraceae bacterium]MBR3508497.1 ABC transporter permease [Lachnospiraceae bacterium]MBR6151186.1 ABC transporter permease [Lachnospiraceae bacterium]